MFGGVELSPQVRPGRSSREIPHRGQRLLANQRLASQLSAFCAAFLMSLNAATAASAADRIRIAAQKTGTLAWELDIIKAHGLDKQADLDIQVVELASTEAGKIALRSGSADLIVSDWLWVARQRAEGGDLTFIPFSSAIGGVIVPAVSPIGNIAGLCLCRKRCRGWWMNRENPLIRK